MDGSLAMWLLWKRQPVALSPWSLEWTELGVPSLSLGQEPAICMESFVCMTVTFDCGYT